MRPRARTRFLLAATLAHAALGWPAFAGDAPAPRSGPPAAHWPDFLAWAETAPALWVSPDGKPDAPGTSDRPLSLHAAFNRQDAVKPGHVVWVRGGTYTYDSIEQNPSGWPGTKEKPVIFRAVPGERPVITITQAERFLRVQASHTWLWGLEITGCAQAAGLEIRNGEDIRIINMHIYGNKYSGFGGWAVGNDHAYYGNIIHGNGIDGERGHYHGIYAQNTKSFNMKQIVDNILFYQYSCGLHVYGQDPVLSGFHVEGNISFGNGLPSKGNAHQLEQGQINLLLGGYQPITNIVLKDNCTYQPDSVTAKRGVDIGYSGDGNRDITVEGNYFMGGQAVAIRAKDFDHAKVTGNTFWAAGVKTVHKAAEDIVHVIPWKDKESITWDNNTYIANGAFDLAAWQAKSGFDKHSKVVPGKNGRPAGLRVFSRVNRYEPSRVHLAVYNWDHKESVELDLANVLKKGQKFAIRNTWDLPGKPAVEGTFDGGRVVLPMKGHLFEPEFGAYLLLRE